MALRGGVIVNVTWNHDRPIIDMRAGILLEATGAQNTRKFSPTVGLSIGNSRARGSHKAVVRELASVRSHIISYSHLRLRFLRSVFHRYNEAFPEFEHSSYHASLRATERARCNSLTDVIEK